MKRRNALYVQKIENIKETQRRVHGRTLCFFYVRFIYERSNHSKCRKHTYGKPGIPVSGYGDRKGGDLAVYLPEIQERRRLAQKRKQKSAVPVTPAKQVVSRQAQRNREKAMAMNKGFVLFLTAVSIAVLFTCINYLQVKSEITASMKNVANLESELAQLKEDNDAYYSQVTSTVDISEIKKKAIGELGMKYPSEDQIQTYTTEGNSYVRQYQDVDTHK